MSISDSTFVVVQRGEETIKVGNGVLDRIPADLQDSVKSSKYVVIMDTTIHKLYGQTLIDSFAKVL